MIDKVLNILNYNRIIFVKQTVETGSKTKENTMIASEEKIQVVDKDGNDINYEKLNKTDKEIVLTELLLQTALQSIAEKRIVRYLNNH